MPITTGGISSDEISRIAVNALLERENDFIARFIRGASLAQVLEELVLGIEDQAAHALAVSVRLLSEDGKHLRHGAAPSLPAAYNAAIDGVAIGPNVGSCGTAAFCGHPIYVTDIASDPLWKDYRDLALMHGLRACWSIPILDGDKVLGTFAIYYPYTCSPIETDRALIESAAVTVRHIIQESRRRG